MGKVLAVGYGLICYVLFFATFLYAVGFVDGFGVPKTIDSGIPGSVIPTLLINAALLGVFAVQHSVMARPAFKAWWTRILPEPVERSTYVLLASLALILVFWQWRPLPATVWDVQGPAAMALWALNAVGWLVLLLSTFLISHFDLFGLNQVWSYATGKSPPAKPFHTPAVLPLRPSPALPGLHDRLLGDAAHEPGPPGLRHRRDRLHPGWHLLRERDLVAAFGDTYRGYQKRVSMLIPWIPKAES
jgi:protein-S-isoprenylcysteine O-methyltransferase Ste14